MHVSLTDERLLRRIQAGEDVAVESDGTRRLLARLEAGGAVERAATVNGWRLTEQGEWFLERIDDAAPAPSPAPGGA